MNNSMIGTLRGSKIKSGSGYIEYLTTKTAGEVILTHDSFGRWDDLFAFEESQSRPTNQARELVLALPNVWLNLSQIEMFEIAETFRHELLPADSPALWALHYEEANGKPNLHMHLMYSERTPQHERTPEVYKKDVWLKEDGKMAFKIADRHELLHRKGDPKRDKETGEIIYQNSEVGYSPKDPRFKSRSFIQDSKQTYLKTLSVLAPEMEILERDWWIPQLHEGKVTDRTKHVDAIINDQSQTIRDRIEPLRNSGQITQEQIDTLKEIAKTEISSEAVKEARISRSMMNLEAFPRTLEHLNELEKQIERTKDAERALEPQTVQEPPKGILERLTGSRERREAKELERITHEHPDSDRAVRSELEGAREADKALSTARDAYRNASEQLQQIERSHRGAKRSLRKPKAEIREPGERVESILRAIGDRVEPTYRRIGKEAERGIEQVQQKTQSLLESAESAVKNAWYQIVESISRRLRDIQAYFELQSTERRLREAGQRERDAERRERATERIAQEIEFREREVAQLLEVVPDPKPQPEINPSQQNWGMEM